MIYNLKYLKKYRYKIYIYIYIERERERELINIIAYIHYVQSKVRRDYFVLPS